MLLNHSLEFALSDSDTRGEDWLQTRLTSKGWHLEYLFLLLRRHGNGGFPLQDLSQCLLLAIQGSSNIDEDRSKETMILLIQAGADISEKNIDRNLVSDITCNIWHVKRTDQWGWSVVFTI